MYLFCSWYRYISTIACTHKRRAPVYSPTWWWLMAASADDKMQLEKVGTSSRRVSYPIIQSQKFLNATDPWMIPGETILHSTPSARWHWRVFLWVRPPSRYLVYMRCDGNLLWERVQFVPPLWSLFKHNFLGKALGRNLFNCTLSQTILVKNGHNFEQI